MARLFEDSFRSVAAGLVAAAPVLAGGYGFVVFAVANDAASTQFVNSDRGSSYGG